VCLVRVPQAGVYFYPEPIASQEEGCRRRQERLAYQHKEEVCLAFLTTVRARQTRVLASRLGHGKSGRCTCYAAFVLFNASRAHV
jgi:hypothetical protein